MADDEVTTPAEGAPIAPSGPVQSRKKRSRLLDYFIVVVILGGVVLAAYYGEPISSFFRLRLWDRGAAGRTLVTFLDAMKQGDEKKATSLLAATAFTPVHRGGRFVGYRMSSMAGQMDYLAEDLAGATQPTVSRTEFMTIGRGAALVYVPNPKGELVKYRLEMTDNGWKVTEILAGRPVR